MLEHLDKTKDLAVKGEGRHALHKPAQEELFAKVGSQFSPKRLFEVG
jgi:hypothetical protein